MPHRVVIVDDVDTAILRQRSFRHTAPSGKRVFATGIKLAVCCGNQPRARHFSGSPNVWRSPTSFRAERQPKIYRDSDPAKPDSPALSHTLTVFQIMPGSAVHRL